MEKVVNLFGVGEANSQKLYEGGNDLSEIQQGLFIGSVAEANNKELLKNSNVTHILMIIDSVALAPPYPDDFVYKVIKVVDRSETDLSVYLDESYSFIDQAIHSGGGVLVHCTKGVSRSVTIVVGYLMKKHGMGFSKAMELVKSRRPQAAPYYGFILQLEQFEKSIQVQGGCAEVWSRDLSLAQKKLKLLDTEFVAATCRVSFLEEKLEAAESDRVQALSKYEKEVVRRTELENALEQEMERYQKALAGLKEERGRGRAELGVVLTSRFDRIGRVINDLNKVQKSLTMWGQVVGAGNVVDQMVGTGVDVPEWLIAKVKKDQAEWEAKVEAHTVTDLLPDDLDVRSLWPSNSASPLAAVEANQSKVLTAQVEEAPFNAHFVVLGVEGDQSGDAR